jgi:N-acyl-D-amino-acid deacylase
MMERTLIRGGTVVDGSGAAGRTADVLMEDGVIVEVGRVDTTSAAVVDADGLLVAPGWVDVHTHYDGQAMWDPLLAPSCWHGVTTVMFGNCGVGFAPVKKHHRGALMDLMEGVEEIPNPVLSAGLTWEWETFPEFMDALERRPHAIDIAAQAAHLPLRVYVMGDRAVRREPATADDIAEMRRLTIEALEVGAFGFTTSRTDLHKTPDGDLVPSRNADADELVGIGSALGAVGGGAFGMNSDFDDEAYELAWLKRLARETKRPVWFLLTDRYDDPGRWRRLMKAVHEARAEGLPMTAQIAGRPIGVMMGIGTALNPFTVRPTYKQLESLPIDGQRMRLRDPNVRRQILAEQPSDAEVAKLAKFRQDVISSWDRFFVMEDPPDYEPPPEKSIAAMAARSGRPPDEVAYDYITEADGRYLYFPLVNYVTGDHAPIHDDERSGVPARAERRRRTLHLDRRLRTAELHAGALGPRPAARATSAAGISGQAPDQRDRGFLRFGRSWPSRAWPARRRQPDRLRRAAARHARTRSRHAGRWSPLCAARRWLCRDARCRTTDLRAR